jgi:hypothetical protein
LTKAELKCSFCGKEPYQVAKLAMNGPSTAAVGNECAQLVVDMAEKKELPRRR